MRTTVELPANLLRAAKVRAAESGESLKTFVARAVAAELDLQTGRRGRKARVDLPLFGRSAGHPVGLTSADLERALANDDACQGPAR